MPATSVTSPVSESPVNMASVPWDAHYATARGYRWWPSEELVRFASRQSGVGDALEVGCGNGGNLWFLARQGFGAVGVDLQHDVLKIARSYCTEQGCGQEAFNAAPPGKRAWWSPVHVLRADARQLPFEAGTFDTVVDVMTSQHLPWIAHGALYAEYRRVLRPEGRLFLYHLTNQTTHDDYTTFDQPAGIRLFPEAGFVCLPNPLSLVLFVEKAGFAAIESRGLTRTYPDGQKADYAVIEGVAA